MKTIATLGPSVRLIVFQYHVKNASIPEGIPKYSDFHKPTASQFEGTGVRVMEPTPDVLSDFVADSSYQLIDAWHATEENDWTRSTVRFVFCHKEHLNPAGLRPEFVAGQDGLLKSFNDLTGKNLWKTMAHINQFFVAGKVTDETVLMLDCNSRKSTVKNVPVETGESELVPTTIEGEDEPPMVLTPVTVMTEEPVTVFQGGREKLGRGVFNPGIGPKVLLTDKANRLKLIDNEVVLIEPEIAEKPDEIPCVMT